jgi:hypothetical protein
MRRIRLLFAAFLFLSYLQIYAQDRPWHIGAMPQANAAMAAINTINIKPGSHQIVVAVIDSGVITQACRASYCQAMTCCHRPTICGALVQAMFIQTNAMHDVAQK